jgi:protein gp37
VLGIWGPNGTRVVAAEAAWRLPLRWDAEAKAAGERRRVFPSLCDPFEDRPELVEPRARLFNLIQRTPNLDWLLLTRRPENIRPMLAEIRDTVEGVERSLLGIVEQYGPLRNLWLGTSVEDQATADERIPRLLRVPAAVRFLSCEPLIGHVNLGRWMSGLDVSRDEEGADLGSASGGSDLDWIIVGGESGPKARPMHIAWMRSLIAQCQAAGVPVFCKQLGSNPQAWLCGDMPVVHDGKPDRVLRDPKGGDWSEWPEDLRVRQFPSPAPPGPAAEARR